MTKVAFYPETHAYEIDGVPVPGVSQVIRDMGLAPAFSGSAAVAAAMRGTAVHAACEAIDWGYSADGHEDAELVPYLRAYEKFLDEYEPEWKISERVVCHPRLMYAGRLDRYGTIRGEKVVVDIKTGTTVGMWHGVQLAAYQLALGTEMPDATDAGRMVVRLMSSGEFKVERHDGRGLTEVWHRAVSLWWWRAEAGLVRPRPRQKEEVPWV